MNETSIVMTENALVCQADSGWVLDQSCQASVKNPGDLVTLDASMKKIYAARPYQTDCLVKLAEMRAQGIDRGIMVMACGLGKTITIILDVARFLEEHPDSRVLYLCHNGEILAGAKEKFEAYFGARYSYGFFMTYANKIEADDTLKKPTFLFASFQTMGRRREQFARDEFDYIIIDEAHHVQARTFAPTVRYFRPKFQLGMTATPFRMDGKKIEELLGEVIYNMDIDHGLLEGWLASIDYKLVLDDIAAGLKEFLDENEKYTVSQLNRQVFIALRDEEIVRIIKQRVKDFGLEKPKMVIYCKTITHARRIATIYGRNKAKVVRANQPMDEVKGILQSLERGEIEAVTSVQKLNEGVDLPSLNMLVFLRNTVSRNVYEQQLGRGTRREADKDTVFVLDFVNNVKRYEMLRERWEEYQEEARNWKQQDGGSGGSGGLSAHFTLDIAEAKFREYQIDIQEVLAGATTKRDWAGTEEEGLAALAAYAEKLGRPPTIKEVNANPDLPSDMWYRRHCGSYNNALRKIGFKIDFKREEWSGTREEGMNGLAEYAKELGHSPTIEELNANPNLPSVAWYKKQCGSYNNALKEIELKPNLEHKKWDGTKEDGLRGLAEYMNELGRPPTKREVDTNPNLPSSDWYKVRFGKYSIALKEAGSQFDPKLEEEKKEKEGLQKLANYAKELGRPPTTKEVSSNPDLPSGAWYAMHFGGYTNALIMIGVVPSRRFWTTAEQALESMRQEFELQGRVLTQKEVNANPNLPSTQTFKKFFKLYSKAKMLVMYTYQSVALPPKEDFHSDEAEKTDLDEVEDFGLSDSESSSS